MKQVSFYKSGTHYFAICGTVIEQVCLSVLCEKVYWAEIRQTELLPNQVAGYQKGLAISKEEYELVRYQAQELLLLPFWSEGHAEIVRYTEADINLMQGYSAQVNKR
ncbi:hypothetical protein HNV11_23785 (plasmid) [Spirosoma taeanense]|uniref:Uncharacterized protein n=1 Tax=Spirosoma taeanense TaxID=2735870 RepID=A0A6M5YGT3_9BACT|nr:hypothetical protein [Spirosoma taeanense]QJW92496.1 hypothetical protein HNV11_23785 [Spirosoma taeanense]